VSASSRSLLLRSLLVGAALVAVLYPQVLFLGGSFAPSAQAPLIAPAAEIPTVSLYPDAPGRAARRANADLGAAAWQLEPATKLMARALRGEDPRWNPWSATGSLGPETIGDLKYAPFTLLAAALGASATAYTAAVVLVLVLSSSSLVFACRRFLRLSWAAATAAAAAHLTNGFAVANVNAQIAAPYFLAPLLLCALLRYRERRDTPGLAVAVAAHVALILTSVVPVVLLVGVAVHATVLLLGRVVLEDGRGADLREQAKVHVLPAALALGAAGFFIVPLVASLAWTADLDQYGQRSLEAQPARQLLSVLSSRHFWDAYVPATMPALLRDDPRWIGHVGLVPLLLVAGGWPRARERRLLAGGLLALAVLGVVHHLGVPGLSILARIPGFHLVRNEYWIALTALTLPLLVALAVDTAARRARGLPVLVVLAGAGALYAGYGVRTGAPPTPEAARTLLVMVLMATLTAGLLAASARGAETGRGRVVVWALVGLLLVEGVFGMTHERPVRLDRDDPAPTYIDFLREHVGDGRVLNIGRAALHPDWGAALGIRQMGTFNLAQSPHYRRLWRENVGRPTFFLEPPHTPQEVAGMNPAVLDLLSVRYIVAVTGDERVSALPERYPLAYLDEDGGVEVLANPGWIPRAHLAGAVHPIGDGDSAYRLPWAGDRAWTDDADLLERLSIEHPDLLGAVPRAAGQASIVEDTTTRVTIAVDSRQAALLVLTDAHHPGWRADLDGKSVPVGRVNGAFRGVVVPEGRSTVTFRYHQQGLPSGLILTMVSLGLMVLFGLRSRCRSGEPSRRHPSEPTESP
jgi:hypothetical protein